ncbi:hypothetical protein ACFWXH_22040 [Mesorhizobium sp. NPDC059054]|uniref:hypothetical protein n=1 Tax=unclassified Mesorhizobium TaxID=325217 RepID=UPI0036C13B24
MREFGQRLVWSQDSASGEIHQEIIFALIKTSDLKRTEEINLGRAASLRKKIENEGKWNNPILLERESKAVMDGNHRLWVAHNLGLQCVPCILLYYGNRHLQLSSWSKGQAVSPNQVVSAGLTGALLGYKTTKHDLLLDLSYPTYSLDELL